MQDPEKPLRGRRLSWREFYQLRPDLRGENDNKKAPPGKPAAHAAA